MKRLAYIDWMRGLACLLMFQTHCYDSWLRPELHDTQLYKLSQLGGTLPAPLFIFLAGVSFALVTEKLREKGIGRSAIAKQTIRRGAEIFALGILFRIQEYALGYKWVTWTDLLRVDVLNILGLSMMLMGVLCWLTAAPTISMARQRGIVSALLVATAIALLTPPLWTTLAAKVSCLGRSKRTSTVRIPITSRNTGCSRSSRGVHLRLRDWRLVSWCSAISPESGNRSSLAYLGLAELRRFCCRCSSMRCRFVSMRSTITGIRAQISFWLVAECCSSSCRWSIRGANGDSRKRVSVP